MRAAHQHPPEVFATFRLLARRTDGPCRRVDQFGGERPIAAPGFGRINAPTDVANRGIFGWAQLLCDGRAHVGARAAAVEAAGESLAGWVTSGLLHSMPLRDSLLLACP